MTTDSSTNTDPIARLRQRLADPSTPAADLPTLATALWQLETSATFAPAAVAWLKLQADREAAEQAYQRERRARQKAKDDRVLALLEALTPHVVEELLEHLESRASALEARSFRRSSAPAEPDDLPPPPPARAAVPTTTRTRSQAGPAVVDKPEGVPPVVEPVRASVVRPAS